MRCTRQSRIGNCRWEVNSKTTTTGKVDFSERATLGLPWRALQWRRGGGGVWVSCNLTEIVKVLDFVETRTELNEELHLTIEIRQVVIDGVPEIGSVAPLAAPFNYVCADRAIRGSLIMFCNLGFLEHLQSPLSTPVFRRNPPQPVHI